MAKKNTKNLQNNKTFPRLGTAWRKLIALPKIVLAMVAFMVVILGYNLVYIPVLTAVERRQYDAAAQEMRVLMDKIVTEIGEPEKTETKKACNYTSIKYSKGDLYCYNKISAEYQVNSGAEANLYANNASKTISTSTLIFPYTDGFDDLNSLRFQSANQKIDFNNHECNAYYEYDTQSNGLRISFSCQGLPKTEIYPLEK